MSRVDISDPKVHEDALVTRQECADYLRITATSWDRLVAIGKAPQKVTPDGVWPRWRAGDIREPCANLKARIRIQNTTPLAETKKALQPHGAGLKIKSTDRPADLAEFGADPQNPFPNGRRATPQASRREAQATREAYRESARPFAPRSLANPPRRDRELRFPQFEACAKAALAKFLSFHWHGARPDARARRRESLPARTREQNNSHSPSRRAKFNCHIRALP